MPPKKKAPEPSKKAEQKKKERIIEDKTFGLKNKKGAKTQKFIQQVQHQVKQGGQNPRKVEQATAVTKKDDKKKELDVLNQIFKPVQKVEKGADPKSVLCAFYKQGQCSKGDKCKFSHDLSMERKGEKKSVYVDMRENEDNMENWDEEKLKEVVAKKHGEREKKLPPTEIICKHFLEALETSKYGWFWECPNGGDKCHYRHALPPGFVLNKDRKRQEKKDDITIEELVEIERAKLGADLKKITLESFLEWKKRKIKERSEKDQKESERKKAEFKAGRNLGLSGREMFTFNPELAMDEDMDEDEAAYENIPREDEGDESYKEINLELLANEAQEVDDTGTQATNKRLEHINSNSEDGAVGGNQDIEDIGPIDETLFDNIDELGEEIDELTID